MHKTDKQIFILLILGNGMFHLWVSSKAGGSLLGSHHKQPSHQRIQRTSFNERGGLFFQKYWICNICDINFETEKEFKNHVIFQHFIAGWFFGPSPCDKRECWIIDAGEQTGVIIVENFYLNFSIWKNTINDINWFFYIADYCKKEDLGQRNCNYVE